MKNTIILFALLLLGLSSCTDVIQVDLDTIEPHPVIDAVLDGSSGECHVRLTKSGGFYQNGAYDFIGGAKIYLQDASGELIPVKEEGQGNYKASNIAVEPGKTYKIILENVLGKNYEAIAEAPYPGEIIDVNLAEVNTLGPDTEYYVSVSFQDRPDIKDHYWMKVYVNGVYQSKIFDYTDDVVFDGQALEFPSEAEFELGDTLDIEFLSINKALYQYIYQVSENKNLAYNPKTNFNGDALGIFGITFTDKKSIIVE